MNDDLDIKRLFEECRPEPADSADFLAGLEKKLDAVEEIKTYHDSQVRRLRSLATLALVVGCVLGALFAALLILKPASSPQVALLFDSKAYLFLMTYKMRILIPIALAFIALGVWQLLKQDRVRVK